MLGCSVPAPVQVPSNSWNGPLSARAGDSGPTMLDRTRMPPSKAADDDEAKERCKGIFPYMCGLDVKAKLSPALTANGVVMVPR